MACSPASLKIYRERPIVYKSGWQSHKPGDEQTGCGFPSLVSIVEGQRLRVSIVGVVGGAVTEYSDRIAGSMLLSDRWVAAA